MRSPGGDRQRFVAELEWLERRVPAGQRGCQPGQQEEPAHGGACHHHGHAYGLKRTNRRNRSEARRPAAEYMIFKAIIVSGYFLELDTARTARSAGIPMGPRAVLPSNTCGAHQTFHDWL